MGRGKKQGDVFDPTRQGLSSESVANLANCL